MKANAMRLALASLGLVCVFAAHAQDGELSEADHLLLRSAAEVSNKTAIVLHVFEYCAEQDDDFILRSAGALPNWKERNLDYVGLTTTLREQVLIMGERHGITRPEMGTMLDEAPREVIASFAEEFGRMGSEERIRVCDGYAEKIREGELDIGHGDSEVTELLDIYVEAAKR